MDIIISNNRFHTLLVVFIAVFSYSLSQIVPPPRITLTFRPVVAFPNSPGNRLTISKLRSSLQFQPAGAKPSPTLPTPPSVTQLSRTTLPPSLPNNEQPNDQQGSSMEMTQPNNQSENLMDERAQSSSNINKGGRNRPGKTQSNAVYQGSYQVSYDPSYDSGRGPSRPGYPGGRPSRPPRYPESPPYPPGQGGGQQGTDYFQGGAGSHGGNNGMFGDYDSGIGSNSGNFPNYDSGRFPPRRPPNNGRFPGRPPSGANNRPGGNSWGEDETAIAFPDSAESENFSQVCTRTQVSLS